MGDSAKSNRTRIPAPHPESQIANIAVNNIVSQPATEHDKWRKRKISSMPDHLLERCKDGVLDVGLDTGCKPTDKPKPVKIKPKNFGFRKMHFRKQT